MAVPVSYPAGWDDPGVYPLHEEDDVPEIPPHEATNRYLRGAIAARFPTWFVTGDVCVYWEPGNRVDYRAPDVLVVKEPLFEEVYRVYQTWKQPRVTFVAEIGSKSTFREDEGPKVEIYRDLIRAEEYLYADPPHSVLRLWRLDPAGEVEVLPGANRRVRSEALGLEFGLDEAGDLRAYTLEGEVLLTHAETEAARQAAETARQAAEARAADLERQLAALQARLGELDKR